jgi:WD40 repeat protein
MSKKNRNIIIVVVVIIILVLLMHYANSNSDIVRQLSGPIEGTDGALTIGDKLFVVSKNNCVFTWQWNDLKIWPAVAKQSVTAITPFANDKIIYNPSNSSAKLILTNLKADEKLGDLSLPYGAECKAIKTSQNGKFGILSVDFKEGTQKGLLKLGVFNKNFKELSFVFQKDTSAENLALYDFTITNNGQMLAGVGEKGKAWVFVSDVNSQSILWKKTFDKHDKFTCVEFSPDSKFLATGCLVRPEIKIWKVPQLKNNTPPLWLI